MIFFLISSTDNELSELEIELEILEREREELKTKLQTERLRKWKNSEDVEQLTLKTLRIRCEKLKVVRIRILIIHHMRGLTVYKST